MLTIVCGKLDKEEAENQVAISESLKLLMKTNTVKLSSDEIQLIFESALEALKNWTTINNQHLVEVIEIAIEIQSDRTQILKEVEKTIL